MRALRSELLTAHGFQHGFSLRTGGVSAPPYASLNLGRGVGDAPAAVAENHELFARELGYAAGRLYEVSQVHGCVVARLDPQLPPVDFRAREADAIVGAAPGCALGIRVADCVPILLADPETGAVAAVHAGWRGIVAEIVPRAVQALGELGGSSPQRLLAAVFPSIGVAAFEVGEEVGDAFVAAGLGACVERASRSKPHVDLARAVRLQLEASGLPAPQIDRLHGCTFAEPTRFFSHRRDRGLTGRHLAAIVSRC